jgi:hypothetical protein
VTTWTEGLTTAAAGIGLALGVWNWASFRRNALRANPAAVLQEYRPALVHEDKHLAQSAAFFNSFNRVALTNTGPATARNVTAVMFKKGADAPEDWASDGLWHHWLPLPELHPGQTFFLPVIPDIAVLLDRVEVTWSDRRWRRQSRSIWLSTERIPG